MKLISNISNLTLGLIICYLSLDYLNLLPGSFAIVFTYLMIPAALGIILASFYALLSFQKAIHRAYREKQMRFFFVVLVLAVLTIFLGIFGMTEPIYQSLEPKPIFTSFLILWLSLSLSFTLVSLEVMLDKRQKSKRV